MIKQTIKYTDYNDVEHTEDLYFNLSKKELFELKSIGIEERINALNKNAEPDGAELFDLFSTLVLKAYGQKSEDGIHFRKDAELVSLFASSAAYEALLDELLFDPDKATAFINGIMPKDLAVKAGLNVK